MSLPWVVDSRFLAHQNPARFQLWSFTCPRAEWLSASPSI
jgi:hypothetical protein